MKKVDFEKLVSDITSENITLFVLENQDAVKWYDKRYLKNFDAITPETKYGVSVDNGSIIDFDFKSGKNMDNLLKTFITQYASKKQEYGIVDGEVRKLNKTEVLDKIIKNNQDRVHKGLFYTTLYGIGMWDFFNSPMIHNILNKEMSSFLKSMGINYHNEYSDAGWVFRYKFNLPIEKTNELLNKFTVKND
jgi:hypothetical protein